AINSSDYFASNALELLNELKITDLVFGSESNDASYLIKCAKTSLSSSYQALLKSYIKNGQRYATACNMAFKEYGLNPLNDANDILGLAYIKAIIKNEYPIKIHTIKRTNQYLDENLSFKPNEAFQISSATAIRKALINKESITNQTSMASILVNNQENVYLEDFFTLLKYQLNIISKEKLKNIYGISEGIENLLLKHINMASSMSSFINLVSSKRYPKTRIQRLIIYILLNLTKEEHLLIKVDYIRILGMSLQGQSYLKLIKEKTNYHIITSFAQYHSNALSYEHRISLLYSLANTSLSYLYHKEYQQQVLRPSNERSNHHDKK
ncbi:MAG: nucleotidyltransferase family protein, partial [Bacilli bacterium]